MDKIRKTVPEDIVMEILARLPMKSIARFKSVSKTWNSETESPYFLRRHLSLYPNSSTWSLMFITKRDHPITEAIGFHRGDTWNLPNSLASYVLPFQPYPDFPTVDNYSLKLDPHEVREPLIKFSNLSSLNFSYAPYSLADPHETKFSNSV